MDLTFEQARAILAEDLDMDGDTRGVAAWGWENDELFVLDFDNTAGASIDEAGSDGEDDEEAYDYEGDDPELDGWGTPEDLEAVVRHVALIPRGWDAWAGQPVAVPVVEKATGYLRWQNPAGLGEPVAPNLRPIGEVPEGQLWRDGEGNLLNLDALKGIWADDVSYGRLHQKLNRMSDGDFEDRYSFGSWLYQKLLVGTYDLVDDSDNQDASAR